MKKPIVKRIVVGGVQTNCYVVKCPETGAVMIIDPGDTDQAIEEGIQRVDTIIYTHGHFDHVGGALGLIRSYSPLTMIHSADVDIMASAASHSGEWGFSILQPPPPDRLLKDGDEVEVGNMTFKILHTPGHSPGSVCVLGHGLLFSGDTLFAGSIGRTDLPGSSPEAMKETLKNIILLLDDDLTVYPGHGPSTTIRKEKRNNPFL